MTEFLRRWGLALLWTALIFAVSSRPTLPVDLHSGSDKLAHFAAYGVLGVLLAYGQNRARFSPVWVVILGSAIGALDELYQSTVPNRVADVGDWIADSLGVAAGVLLFHLLRRGRAPELARGRRSDPLPHE